jgi:predicted Rdx family selenoprotein
MAAAKPTAKPTAAKPAAAKPAQATTKPAQQAKPATAVSKPAPTSIRPRDENLPAYIKQGGPARGSENVETSDLVIPRIELVQALSPCINANKAEFIEGAKLGDFFNTVTRAVYPAEEGVLVIPILYKKEFLIWKDRKQGGGFRGSYATLQEANERIAGEEDAEHLVANETGQQLVLVVNPDGTTDETMMAMVSMSRTKLKVSKNWNSLIRLNGGDRFSRVYRLISVDEQNSTGDDYKNIAVMAAGFPEEAAYREAEKIYLQVSGGALKYTIDVSQEGVSDEEKGSTEY